MKGNFNSPLDRGVDSDGAWRSRKTGCGKMLNFLAFCLILRQSPTPSSSAVAEESTPSVGRGIVTLSLNQTVCYLKCKRHCEEGACD